MSEIKITKEDLFCIDAELQVIGDHCITYLARHQDLIMQQVYRDNNWCIPEISVTNATESSKYITSNKMMIDVWFSNWDPESESAELAKYRSKIDDFLRDYGLKTAGELKFIKTTEDGHLYQWPIEKR